MVAPSVSIRLNKTAFEITVQLSNYYLNLRLYCFLKKKEKSVQLTYLMLKITITVLIS